MIKAELDEAEALQDSLDQQLQQRIKQCVQLKTQFDQAASATRKAYHGAEKGLSDTQRELAQANFPTLTADDLGDIVELERKHTRELQQQLRTLDFQPGRYLRLVARKVIHESLRTLQHAQRQLNSARFIDDEGESHYKVRISAHRDRSFR